MPAIDNPYIATADPYPTPDYGGAVASLGTALFGNRQAAIQQQLMRAQMANYTADAAQRQGDAADAKTAAEGALPGAFSGAYGTTPATAPSYGAPDASGVMAITPASPGGQRVVDPVGLAHLLATLAQTGVADPKGYVGALGAFAGGDSDARRALVAQGQTPGENFALDIPRAQQIAATKEAADTARQVAVADTTGNRSLQGKKVEAGATVQSAGIHAGAERYGADVGASTLLANNTADNAQRDRAVDAKATGKVPQFSPSQLGNMDKEIQAQAPGLEDPALKTSVRTRAIDLARRSGNPASAVKQALGELVTTNPHAWLFGLGGPSYTAAPAAGGWSATRTPGR